MSEFRSEFLSEFLSELRLSVRTLARSPRFAALAVLTLAVGIGGTTALFSMVDAVLLRALPFKDADRLVEVFGQEGERSGMRVPEAMLDALRARSATLEAIAIHGPTSGVLRTADGVVDLRGDRVSANFVDVMGIAPLLGRGFLPEEDRPGAPAVILVSFGFWQQRLGGDASAIGRTVSLDGIAYTVVGVMPPGFRTQFRGLTRDYWTPYVSDRIRALERTSGVEPIARVRPRVAIEDARREVQAIAASAGVPGWSERGRRLGLHPLKNEVVRDSAYVLELLLAAVVVVLAMTCANLAQLLLARSDRRVSEFAVRKALGAGTVRLFRQALLESLVLSAAGGLVGVLLAWWLVPAIITLAPLDIPRLDETAVDGRVLLVAVGVTLITGCTFGLVPAWRLSRLSVVQAMKRAPGHAPGRGATQRPRVAAVLVVIQVAASVALFALAGLIGQTFLTLLPSRPGFAAESRIVFPMSLRPDLFPEPADRRRLADQLVHHLQAAPGVEGVGFASNIPFAGEGVSRPVRDVEHAGEGGANDVPVAHAERRTVSANLFQLLDMPLLRGRTFTAADGPASPRVAIVNQRLAGRLAAGSGVDVLGRRIRIGESTGQPPLEIVGVVADARSSATSVEVQNEIYIPSTQSDMMMIYLVVRSPLESGAVTAAIRRAVSTVAPELPLPPEQRGVSMQEVIDRALAGPRFSATLMSAFSAMGLLVAVVGLFGLVTYSVSQRRQELGIRAALGARPRALVLMAMRSALALTALGIVAGLIAGAWLTRFVEQQLHGIEPLHAPTFVGAAILMLVAAGLAAWLPARHAVRTDPLTALRHD